MFRCLDVIRRPVPCARAAAKTCYRRRKKKDGLDVRGMAITSRVGAERWQ